MTPKGRRVRRPHRLSDAERLRIARAQLGAIRRLVTAMVAQPRSAPAPNGQPAPHAAAAEPVPEGQLRLTQCWPVQRGYSAVTQGLDAEGRVWERVTLMVETMEGDKKVKAPGESWWRPVAMERRA